MRTFVVSKKNRFYQSSTSKGNQIKWVIRDENGDILYLKANQFGYEGISEALASELLHYVRGVYFVDYCMCCIVEEGAVYNGCYSKNMLREGESVISLYRLLKCSGINVDSLYSRYSGIELAEYVCSTVFKITGCDIRSYLKVLFGVDWLLLNEDRRLNNISLIKGNCYYRTVPIFDNGLSLASDVSMYPLELPISVCKKKIKAKPFSTSFSNQYRYFEGEPLKVDFDGFCSALGDCTVDYGKREYARAKSLLLSNMKDLEGIVWVRG